MVPVYSAIVERPTVCESSGWDNQPMLWMGPRRDDRLALRCRLRSGCPEGTLFEPQRVSLRDSSYAKARAATKFSADAEYRDGPLVMVDALISKCSSPRSGIRSRTFSRSV